MINLAALNKLFVSLLFLMIFLLLHSCEPDNNHGNHPSIDITFTVTETFGDAELHFGYVQVGDDAVPLFFYLPNEASSLIVGLHPQSGKKEDWRNWYSHVLQHAIDSQKAFIAFDLYGHGEWAVEGYDTDTISAPNLKTFMEPTTEGVSVGIGALCQKAGISTDSLHYVGVSLGCFTAMDLSMQGLKPKSMSMIVPVPLKAFDGPFSFHNNMDAFQGVSLFAISGTDDEYNEVDEVKEWVDAVESEQKKLIMYDGGHVPVLSVFDSCVSFLQGL